jgi:hypothetical protein
MQLAHGCALHTNLGQGERAASRTHGTTRERAVAGEGAARDACGWHLQANGASVAACCLVALKVGLRRQRGKAGGVGTLCVREKDQRRGCGR